MRSPAWILASVALPLCVGCEKETPTQGPNVNVSCLLPITARPEAVRQGVGGTSVVGISVCLSTDGAGATGRPFPLTIDAEQNGVLEPIGATSVRMTTPGELTFRPGPPPVYNSFVSQNVASSFELSLTCARPGKADVVATEAGTTARATISVECTTDPPTGTRPPREFANGVGELGVVNRAGAAFTVTPGGVASNLGERTPEMRARFLDIGAFCEKFEGITDFVSVKGKSSLGIATGLQTATATYDDAKKKYVWTGFVAGPLFGAQPVAFDDGSSRTVAPPPAFGPIDQVLSPPSGLDTRFYVPEAETDLYVTLFGSLSGNSGFSCLYPVNELPLENGKRSTMLVPSEVRAALPSVATQLSEVIVGKATAAALDDFYSGAGPRQFQAGRLLRIRRSYLDP